MTSRDKHACDRPLLITGKRGTLGSAFARRCERREIPHVILTRQEMDITSPPQVDSVLERLQPWAVVNAAGYARVDRAEMDRENCMRANVRGPEVLAAACARRRISLVNFSSDLVFDGQAVTPYLESSPARPLNVYGESKSESEKVVLGAHPSALVIRTCALFGPWNPNNFVHTVVSVLQKKETYYAPANVRISPTYLPEFVDAALDLLIRGESGIRHLANAGELSWADFARAAARMARLDPARVIARPASSMPWLAARPHYSALGSERGDLLRPIDEALRQYFEDTREERKLCA